MGLLKIFPLAFIALIWYSYASFGNTKCEKIERGLAPVRFVMDMFSWGVGPWVGADTKFSIIKFEISSDRFMREIAAKQIYKSDLVTMGCEAPKPEVNEVYPVQEDKDVKGSILDGLNSFKKSMNESFAEGMESTNKDDKGSKESK
jgi:hypothetical protein